MNNSNVILVIDKTYTQISIVGIFTSLELAQKNVENVIKLKKNNKNNNKNNSEELNYFSYIEIELNKSINNF